MGIPILVRSHLYIEMVPRHYWLCYPWLSCTDHRKDYRLLHEVTRHGSVKSGVHSRDQYRIEWIDLSRETLPDRNSGSQMLQGFISYCELWRSIVLFKPNGSSNDLRFIPSFCHEIIVQEHPSSPGAHLSINMLSDQNRSPHIKMIWSHDCLIFIMAIPILWRSVSILRPPSSQ